MDDGQRQNFEQELRIHHKNLGRLKIQAAQHNIDVSPELDNRIQHEVGEIARLEGILGVAQSPIDPKDLRQLRRQARKAYCKSDWEQAEEWLMRVVSLDPADASFREMLQETQRQLETKQIYEMIQEFRREGDYRAVTKALDTLGQQLSYVDTKELRDWASEYQRHEEHRASLWATGKKLLVDAEAVAADSPNSMTAWEVLAQARAMQQTIERFVGQVTISISVGHCQEPLVLK